MPLTVLCSLAAMLQLMSSLLHLVSLCTPAWVQLGVLVPVGGGSGEGEINATMSGYSAAPEFVKVRMGLWEWCHQFQKVSPLCREPGFLVGVETMAVVALFLLPLSFALLTCTACQDRDSRKRRVFTLLSLLTSFLSVLLVLAAVSIYGVLTRREITYLMSLIGEETELSYLGWAFGADVVSGMLVGLAALFICIHLRQRHSSKASQQFELVV